MPASPTAEAAARPGLTRDDVASVYHSPLLELIFRAAEVHRLHHDPSQVQVCVLLSVKTGGCSEDCGYCPQSAHFKTQVTPEGLMDVGAVVSAAERARAEGATRFCMGAAWREVHDGRGFDRVLEMVRSVKSLGLETCCTLGMLTPDQARRLKEAGLDAYNHNLDTSPEYYAKVITTRTYDERLETLGHVRDAGISVCCGGIVGMGETDDDRIGLLHTLASLPQHPESVPVNALVAVSGTPLEGRPKVDVFSMVRMIATARLLMPRSMVRLSAGRVDMTEAEQALCFLAGANSIFAGEKLLTTPNPGEDRDRLLFEHLNLTPRPSVHAEV